MKNENNKLNLKRKTNIIVVELQEGITVGIPTRQSIANAKILDVFEDGSFTAHYTSNWNEEGDFSTELLRFDEDLVFDNGDKKKRNKIREDNGLLKIN